MKVRRCPRCGGSVTADAETLYCIGCGSRYAETPKHRLIRADEPLTERERFRALLEAIVDAGGPDAV